MVEITEAFDTLSEVLSMEDRLHFNDALNFVLAEEGGYNNDPDDRGGPTYKGITQANFDKFMERRELSKRDVRTIRDDEIYEFYREGYWLEAKCFLLPKALSIIQFDSAVNHSPGQAVEFLQESIKVVKDGIVGPNTRAAITDRSWKKGVICKYLALRKSFYYRIVEDDKTQKKWMGGWMNRLDHLREYISI